MMHRAFRCAHFVASRKRFEPTSHAPAHQARILTECSGTVVYSLHTGERLAVTPHAHLGTYRIRRSDGSTLNAMWLWETKHLQRAPQLLSRDLICLDLDHVPTQHTLTFPDYAFLCAHSSVAVFFAIDRSTLLFYSLRHGYGCVTPVRPYEDLIIYDVAAYPAAIAFIIRDGRFHEVFLLVTDSPPAPVPLTTLASFPRVTARLLVTLQRRTHRLTLPSAEQFALASCAH